METPKRTVYLLFTRSETYFSRLIHRATSSDFTHASIGLEGPSGPFYSFARLYPALALPAGLIQEHVDSGFFARHPDTPCRLYALTVSEEAYRLLESRLHDMYAQRSLYSYNLIGAFACFFRLRLLRRYHYFCSQFVATLLSECGAADFSKPPELTMPMDFIRTLPLRELHRGAVGALAAPASAA